jgi:hypothetical protein
MSEAAELPKKEEEVRPEILYRNFARIEKNGYTQLDEILSNGGIKSKAQLFIEGEPTVRLAYEKKGWTVDLVREKYKRVLEKGVCNESFYDKGALYDELEVEGPSPLISTTPDKEVLLGWRSGPILGFRAHNLETVNVMPLGVLVVNFIPSSELTEIIIFDDSQKNLYSEVLARHKRSDVVITVIKNG